MPLIPDQPHQGKMRVGHWAGLLMELISESRFDDEASRAVAP